MNDHRSNLLNLSSRPYFLNCLIWVNYCDDHSFAYKVIFFSNRSLGFIKISQISVYSDSWKPCCIILNLQKYLPLKIFKVWFNFLLACLTEKGIGSILAHVFIYTRGEIVAAGRVEVILTMWVYNPASTVIHELKFLKGAGSRLAQGNWEQTTWKKAESLLSSFPPLQSSPTQSVQSWVIPASNLSDLLVLWSTFTKLQIDRVIFTDRWTFRFLFRCHPLADSSSVKYSRKRDVKIASKTPSLQIEYLRICLDDTKCTSGTTSEIKC